MLRIYLPSSTDLKLCSNVPIIDFVDTWTFICHRIYVSNPYLRPGTWVLTSGSLQMGLKWFVNLWDTGNWSKMICQPLGHLLGPGSRVPGPGSRTQDPGPRTRIADLLPFELMIIKFVLIDFVPVNSLLFLSLSWIIFRRASDPNIHIIHAIGDLPVISYE